MNKQAKAVAVVYGVRRTQYEVLVIAQGGAIAKSYTGDLSISSGRLDPDHPDRKARAVARKTALEMAKEFGVPTDRVAYDVDLEQAEGGA